jgi:amino acid permease
VDQPISAGLLSRNEVLGGLPARRASTLLFAIEGRTAHRMMRTRQEVTRMAAERTAEQQERAFLGALAIGRDIPLQPRIQDLERHAADWAALVPADPGVCAAVGGLLADKFRFKRQDVPRIRDVLGLDTQPVADAYMRQHARPLAGIFSVRTSWRERRRWAQAAVAERLETLPPFWTVFALTLTEMVEAAILALPTAVAGIGPLAGVALLLVLGVVNIVTIAGLSEAFARDGNVRYGQFYFGRLVADFLGTRSPLITRLLLSLISVLLIADCVGSLVAYCIGITSTLAESSGISAAIWGVVLLAVVLYFLRRETLDLTIASAMVIGAFNLGLLTALVVSIAPHVRTANLLATSPGWSTTSAFDPAVLGLIFGVILAAYFGHFSTGTCARLVLSRDPGGRSLILGNVVAMSVAIVFNCAWVVVVNGTLSPATLLGQSGPSIKLLAAEVGPLVSVIGVVFVVLGMGMGCVHAALGVMYQLREWLATEATPVSVEAIRSGALASAVTRLRRSGFALSAMPIVLIFGLAEWLAAQGVSFAGPIGVLGVLAYSVLGGILPTMVLFASRRKGERVPGLAWRIVGHPVVLVAVYVLFSASFFVHGLVIWEDPVQRLTAVGVGGALVILTVLVVRAGGFAPRAVVEVRIDPDTDHPDGITVNVVDSGRWGAAQVQLDSGFRRAANITVPVVLARQLKVWTHRETANGDSVGLVAHVEIRDGHEVRALEMSESVDQFVVALSGAPYAVKVQL